MTVEPPEQSSPVSLGEVRKQLRARLAYLERQIAPLAAEAEEIRRFLGAEAVRSAGGARKSSNGSVREPADTRAAILSAVRSKPGLSGADYGGNIGVTAATALRYLKELSDAGTVRREGERRGTRWRPA